MTYVKNYMKRDEIRALIKELARSQGFYSRLDARLIEIQEHYPVEYDQLMNSLEAEHFNDIIDLILYLEG